MKIAFFSVKTYEQEFFDRFNTDHNMSYFTAPLNETTAQLAEGHEVACAFVNDKLNEFTLTRLFSYGVRLIALRCAGYNNVDLSAARRIGIKLVRVPAYSPHAVAEHAMALILTLNRKIHKAYNRVREGNFSLDKLVGFDLFKKTIGVIGTGKIGAAFSEIAMGFGCHVIAYDMQQNPELINKGVVYTTMDEVLQQSDILSLHCPLTKETHHLMTSEAISKMKKGAMLINTSRGALVETQAVIEALKTGQLGYLGLDVYEQEEQFFFKDLSEMVIQDEVLMRLMSFPNVIITSHQGFLTEEALTQIALITLENINAYETGRVLENEIVVL